MRKRVTVTQEDIDKGQPNATGSCPIALAARRALGQAYVYQARIYAISACEAPLPRSAQQFIRNFDGGRPVQPFSFYVEVPE